MHLTSERGRGCELRDGTPTVARTTTRPSTVGQRFSRRVRWYPVSLGRRTLRRPAHSSGACHEPRAHWSSPVLAEPPSTRHRHNPSTLKHAPPHRREPSAHCDVRAHIADGYAALGSLQQNLGCPMSTRIGPERGLTRWLRGHVHSISMLDEPAMRELCARVRAWCQVQATGAGRAWARRLLSMAATPLSCFRWRPPFRPRQLPPAIVVELKLHRSTLLWRLRAASFVAAEGAAEWEARWCTLLTHSRD